jgi:excisionase family DNA binding protein
VSDRAHSPPQSTAGETPLLRLAPTVTAEDEDLLTIADLAALHGVSKIDIYQLIHSGRLPAVKIGGSVRVSESEARALLERGE